MTAGSNAMSNRTLSRLLIRAAQRFLAMSLWAMNRAKRLDPKARERCQQELMDALLQS